MSAAKWYEVTDKTLNLYVNSNYVSSQKRLRRASNKFRIGYSDYQRVQLF
jgi:hypothetical protein